MPSNLSKIVPNRDFSNKMPGECYKWAKKVYIVTQESLKNIQNGRYQNFEYDCENRERLLRIFTKLYQTILNNHHEHFENNSLFHKWNNNIQGLIKKNLILNDELIEKLDLLKKDLQFEISQNFHNKRVINKYNQNSTR